MAFLTTNVLSLLHVREDGLAVPRKETLNTRHRPYCYATEFLINNFTSGHRVLDNELLLLARLPIGF